MIPKIIVCSSVCVSKSHKISQANTHDVHDLRRTIQKPPLYAWESATAGATRLIIILPVGQRLWNLRKQGALFYDGVK